MKKMRSVRTTMVASGKEREKYYMVSVPVSHREWMRRGGGRERVKSITVNELLFVTTLFCGLLEIY